MTTPTLKPSPEKCPGAYSLDMYCKYDNPDHEFAEFPHEFYAPERGADARRAARDRGWIIHHDGTGTCPKCVRALGLRIQPPKGDTE